MVITLRACRVNAGYTLISASKELEVSPTTLRGWEKGKSKPTKNRMIEAIEELYGVKRENIKEFN